MTRTARAAAAIVSLALAALAPPAAADTPPNAWDRAKDPARGYARASIEAIHRHAEAAGRDPAAIGLQSMVAPPPRDAEGKRFYAMAAECGAIPGVPELRFAATARVR